MRTIRSSVTMTCLGILLMLVLFAIMCAQKKKIKLCLKIFVLQTTNSYLRVNVLTECKKRLQTSCWSMTDFLLKLLVNLMRCKKSCRLKKTIVNSVNPGFNRRFLPPRLFAIGYKLVLKRSLFLRNSRQCRLT